MYIVWVLPKHWFTVDVAKFDRGSFKKNESILYPLLQRFWQAPIYGPYTYVLQTNINIHQTFNHRICPTIAIDPCRRRLVSSIVFMQLRWGSWINMDQLGRQMMNFAGSEIKKTQNPVQLLFLVCLKMVICTNHSTVLRWWFVVFFLKLETSSRITGVPGIVQKIFESLWEPSKWSKVQSLNSATATLGDRCDLCVCVFFFSGEMVRPRPIQTPCKENRHHCMVRQKKIQFPSIKNRQKKPFEGCLVESIVASFTRLCRYLNGGVDMPGTFHQKLNGTLPTDPKLRSSY